ncbi:hypothetical protein ACFVP3_06745 [Streptomyces sp. NPDC057806]|uniref:hypothetical protein n=1 Tax=Streptomyces sp. NPDC057806 TaxID=3346255 RepID=UPI0036853519
MTTVSLAATMIGEMRRQGARQAVTEWYGALFVLFVPTIPHTDTHRSIAGGSASMLRIMLFGLLLLSCRGEGL